jgi:phage virion morphogenesis protein
MTQEITVTVNDAELQNLFATVISRITDMTPVMRKIAGVMADSVEENFAREGRPTTWRKSHRATRDGGKTLQDTGRLAASISQRYTNRTAIIGTNVAYARMMQFGALRGSEGVQTVIVHGHQRIMASGRIATVREHTRQQLMPWGDVPARPFMMIQDEDWQQMKDVLNQYIFSA